MRKYVIPNMRLGATSFLLHETYVPAVRFAAERCDDVALLLVEPGERNEYLATPGEIVEIGRIIAGERATLHVHLPTDADFDTWEGARSMIGKIRRVAELTGPLDPHSFVLHVDFPSLYGTGGEPSAEQQEWTAALRHADIVREEMNGWTALVQSRAQVDASEESLRIAGENLSISTYSYGEGLATILDVLQAQLSWIQLYSNAIRAHYNYAVAVSDYQRITAQ